VGIFNKNPDQEYNYFLLFLITLAVLLLVAVYLFFYSGDYLVLRDAWGIIKNTWWIILPVPIWFMYDRAWGEYRWTTFRGAKSREYVFLQVIPPNDIEKSPRAMESVFTGLHTWSKPNFFENYCGWRIGQDRYSFEIVGDGEHGARFILRVPQMGKNLVESLIYAQYPEAEIREIENYTKEAPIEMPNKEWDLWGTTLKLLKPDCIPIRTHREFKDEITGEAVDPLASLMEVISKLGKNERLWVQIIFSPKNEPDWVPQANAEMKKIIESFIEQSGGDLEDGFNINKLPPGEQDLVKAIKNSLARVAFKTTFRFVYFGKRNKGFNKATGVGGTMGSLKQFNDNNLNSFVPDNRTKTFANYHFQATRLRYRQRKIFNDFKGIDRTGISYILTAEELATMYHFPTMNVKSSALNRVEAKKSGAPVNLPFEES
jgi:hypothetical protein